MNGWRCSYRWKNLCYPESHSFSRGKYKAQSSKAEHESNTAFLGDDGKGMCFSNIPMLNLFFDLSRIPLVRTSSELAVRRTGKARERAVPSPSPGRHAATRSCRKSSSSSPPTADGFGTGTPGPSRQSQSFFRGYRSILPTSLAYIVPLTRGCSPWRPDAVISTTGRRRHSVLRIFKGRRERTGHRTTCGALPTAGPYLRLSRFQGGLDSSPTLAKSAGKEDPVELDSSPTL
ncbi:unnamed protein product [Linum tenue]|uniref:Uncharacterized protein n=1 Tax=Linum tenue TaxID=586396 RepID=A0AAV0L3M0_9ROSI|nr:unnamed protein product [Linum tenue]